MSGKRALIAANSYQRDQDWLVEVFQQNAWETVVTFGELATQRALRSSKEDGRGFDVFVITDIWMQLFTTEEHQLPDALKLLGLNVFETGIRLCEFAKELGFPPEKTLCIDVAENDVTVKVRVCELGACYTDYDDAEARLRQIMKT